MSSQPHNRQAEEALLGSILINPQTIRHLTLDSDNFYIIRHRWIFDCMRKLERIDVLTVTEGLGEHLEEVGGQSYLLSLVNNTPTSANAESYAKIIREKAKRRRLLATANELAKFALNEESDIAESTSEIMTALVSINQVDKQSESLSGVASKLYDSIKERYDNPVEIFGIPTGIADWDKVTSGNQKGELTIVSGIPGVGKSKLLVQMAFGMAKHEPGVIYSMEMTGKRLMMRQLSVFSKVPVYRMKSGKLEGGDWDKIVIGIEKLNRANLFISDSTSWNTVTMRADLARLVDEFGIGWFALDYLGKLQDSYGKDDTERTKFISGAVHNFCMDFNLAGIANSSINKEGVSSGKPRLPHLSGSVQLIFDTDNVVFMVAGESQNLTDLYWSKQREGVGGKSYITLYDDPNYPVFSAYTPREGRLPYKDY